ncbi:hydroxycarboxylic acid receptor 2-like [Conger conger]|uniref:hydroxycarboxylic acid receptor 2-like n=1 Tax=Conger conger TaxID=82655 RepID=UPI002A5A0F65|nr:hydroxycarboxylic acid receptor 2-like [Conger conger]
MNNSHCLAAQDLVGRVVPPILIVELILGLPANMVALWIFSCRMPSWRCNTVYLLNLLIADFFLLVSVPFRIDSLMRGEDWVFGGAWCRINLFMLALNRSASIVFMTIVAVDRYFKVVHPHHWVNHLTTGKAIRLSTVTWAVVLALCVPLLATQLLHEHNSTQQYLCRSFSSYSKPPPAIMVHYGVYILEFFLPFLLLSFCSLRIICFLRSRQMDRKQQVKRAIQVVMIIVGVFTVCFLPGIVTGLVTLAIQKLHPNDCDSFRLASQLFSVSIAFTYLNSTLDPVIYCFSSSTFRNTLKASFNSLGIFHMAVSKASINSLGIFHMAVSRRGSRSTASDL